MATKLFSGIVMKVTDSLFSPKVYIIYPFYKQMDTTCWHVKFFITENLSVYLEMILKNMNGWAKKDLSTFKFESNTIALRSEANQTFDIKALTPLEVDKDEVDQYQPNSLRFPHMHVEAKLKKDYILTDLKFEFEGTVKESFFVITKEELSTKSSVNVMPKGVELLNYLLDMKPMKSHLMTILDSIRYQWREIGEQLEINNGQLQSIRYDPALSDTGKLSEVLQLWMDGRKTANDGSWKVSWRKILDVVKAPPIGNSRVHHEIVKFLSHPDIQQQYLSSGVDYHNINTTFPGLPKITDDEVPVDTPPAIPTIVPPTDLPSRFPDKSPPDIHQQYLSTDERRIQSMIETNIQEQGALKVTVVKGMLYGPPRVGKTSLKKHLIEEELTGISPSTGIDRPQTVPIFHNTEVTTTMVASDVRKSHEKEWKPLEIKETLETCLNFLTKSSTSSSSSTGPDQLKYLEQDDTTSESNTTSSTVMTHSQPETKPSTSLEDDITPKSTTTSSTIMNPQSQSSSDPAIEVPPPIIDLIKAGDWSKVNKELEGIEDVTLFQMMDVGGQPEFHDILPLLLTGPALYLLFIRLDQELNKTYTYQYQHEDGSISTSYTSQSTVFQVLHQILSTIDSSSDDGTSAIIIGTHRDKVDKEKCEYIDSCLEEEMEGNAYYERIKYVLGDSIVFPVNNLSDTVKDEIIPLRKCIKRVLSKFKGESLPTAYALFYYLLQYQPTKKILTLNEARDLAKDLKIADDDVEDVLKLFHNKFGSVLYYDDVYNEDGEKLVFCDPNVILQAVNELVAVCFGANPDDRTIAKNLRKTGTITPANFVKLCQFFDDNSRLKNYVINLLKARHILSTITVESNEKYFLPCLLDVYQDTQPVPESQEEVAPLLIKICQKDTRYTTIPPGLFPSIIVMLSDPSQPSTIGTWTLVDQINEKRFKNKVSFFFHHQQRIQVDLIAQPQWIEIRMKQMSPVTAPMIREAVIAAIEGIKRNQTLLGQILNTCTLEFGFYCHRSGIPQYAKQYDETCLGLECTGCKEDKLHDMKENQLIWFKDPSLSTDQTTTGGAQPMTQQLTKVNVMPKGVELSNDHSELLDMKPKMCHLMKVLDPIEAKWEQIGIQLEVILGKLESIRYDPALDNTGKLSRMLQLWMDGKTTAKSWKVSWRKILDVVKTRPIENIEVHDEMVEFLSRPDIQQEYLSSDEAQELDQYH